MKTLYIDCNMGAAGDMLTASLLELLNSPEMFINRFNSLNIPHVTMTAEKTQKCGITGTRVKVYVDDVEEDEHLHEHHEGHTCHHSSLSDIEHIISNLDLAELARKNGLSLKDIKQQIEQ